MIVPTEYTPDNWFWKVAETNAYWSSASRAYLPAGEVPDIATNIDTEAELREALNRVGMADRAPGYVPAYVSMAQARVALSRAGLLTSVEAAITSAGGEAAIAWEYSQTVSRTGALVTTLAPALGLTDAQVDSLFISASQITF